MRIRWKLLILLLIIALLPLIIVSLLNRGGMLRLADDLVARSRESLAEQASRQLEQLVSDQAVIFRRQREIGELVLHFQAKEVEHCLAQEPPVASRVYYAENFATDPPPGLAPSPKHFRFGEDGRSESTPVTLQEQVIKLAPGVSREAGAADVARLSRMVPAYQFLYRNYGEFIYWHYTSLENGVHSCYPGHSSYPSDYDPRLRNWYLQAKDPGSPIWSLPYVEISTRQIIMTAAQPIYRPDGSLAGVTAIDVPAADLVAHLIPPERRSGDAKTFLVFLQDRTERSRPPSTGTRPAYANPGLLILAQPDHLRRGKPASAPFEAEWLDSEDRAQLNQMLQDMIARKSGVRRMAYRGRLSLWAYGLTHELGAYLVMIVPYDEVTAQVQQAEHFILDRTLRQIYVTGGVSLAVILIVLALAFWASRSVTRPVRQLAHVARLVAQGEFDARVHIGSHDELGELGRVFNAMVPQIQDRMRIKQSLSLAMEMQQHLLPSRPPSVKGLDVAGKSIYCDETGGDYYDFLELAELGPDILGVAVGDVTGHGVAAAMLMTTARALLRSQAVQPGPLSQLMNRMNRHLTADTPVGRFMTLFYMVIDAGRREVRWVNGGHDPAILYDSHADAFGELEGSDIPLGIEASWHYQDFGPGSIKEGQVLVIGTDGIWETRDPDGRMFGKQALRDVIRSNAHRSADEISRAITDALAAFRQSSPQEDDVTLVVVKA